MLYASDLISQYYPWYYLVAQYLRHGQLPHWVPEIYNTGYPLLAEGETGVLSPINSFILVMFPFTTAVNLLFFAYALIGFFGMATYLKAIKCDSFSQVIGGSIFVLSGFMITRYFQPAIIFSSLLLPWGMTAIQKQKLHWLPIVIYLQFTAGHAQMALISIAGYLVYIGLLSIPRKFFPLFLIRNSLFVVLGVGLSAIQLLPTYKLYTVSNRRLWDPMVKFTYSLPISHLITYINPNAYGISEPGDNYGFHQVGGSFWEFNLTIWTIPFLLSFIPLITIITKKSLNSLTVIFYLMWFIFLLLSFGGYTPLYRLIAKVPYFPFRAPSRFLLLSTFAATTLCAIGFQQLTRKHFHSKIIGIVIVGVVSVYQMYHQLIGYIKINPSPLITTTQLTTPLPIASPISPQQFIIAFKQGIGITICSAIILLGWFITSKQKASSQTR